MVFVCMLKFIRVVLRFMARLARDRHPNPNTPQLPSLKPENAMKGAGSPVEFLKPAHLNPSIGSIVVPFWDDLIGF